MKTTFRIILTFLSVVASFYFIYWGPFSLIPAFDNIPAIPAVISLLIAISIGFFIWKKTGIISNGLPEYVIMGGVIIGSIGFILGFLGPMIFSPTSNQGPLLGIFITGPIGFLIGLVVGGMYWQVRKKESKKIQFTTKP
jgi:hypothetical protein